MSDPRQITIRPFGIRRLFFWLLPLWGAASIQSAAPVAADFTTNVLPLLQRHCWECHDKRQAKGKLRLDAERFARRESRLGLRVIGPNREKSELYQRLISDDDSYRMPRGAPALSAAEIESIGQWIDHGAPWPQNEIGARADSARSRQNQPAKWIRRGQSLWQRAPGWTIGGGVAGGLGVVLFLLQLCRLRIPEYLAKIRVSWVMVVALLCALGGMREYYLHSPVKPRAAALNMDGAPPWQPDDPDYRLAARPMHPRRLGGGYFRGNDERDPLLFNEGFYLTATIDLTLRNELGERMEAGGPAGSNLFVEILITKAPGATPRLFSKQVMDQVFISRQWIPDWQPAVLEEEVILLEATKVGEQWRAKIPLDSAIEDRMSGNIYVYRGDREGTQIAKINKQYGIHYDLLITNGVITQDSELWMGSMSRHPYIQYTPPDRIPATEWFDFRPMPVIAGTNSTDPRLLGIETGDPQN